MVAEVRYPGVQQRQQHEGKVTTTLTGIKLFISSPYMIVWGRSAMQNSELTEVISHQKSVFYPRFKSGDPPSPTELELLMVPKILPSPNPENWNFLWRT